MIENSGRVERVEGEDAWIVPERPVGCGHCHENPACQVNRGGDCAEAPTLLRVRNALRARPGDRVVVGVPDGAVYHVALLVYAIPLLLALAGAVIAATLGASDGVTFSAAAAGLVLGFAWARRAGHSAATRQRCEPAILRRVA
jgi:sigma-E factor negative regulatory protein RseC